MQRAGIQSAEMKSAGTGGSNAEGRRAEGAWEEERVVLRGRWGMGTGGRSRHVAVGMEGMEGMVGMEETSM